MISHDLNNRDLLLKPQVMPPDYHQLMRLGVPFWSQCYRKTVINLPSSSFLLNTNNRINAESPVVKTKMTEETTVLTGIQRTLFGASRSQHDFRGIYRFIQPSLQPHCCLSFD